MPETKQYEIDYIGACDIRQPTGITITNILTSTVIPSNFYLTKDIICTSSPISSFIFEIATAPKGAVAYAEITR